MSLPLKGWDLVAASLDEKQTELLFTLAESYRTMQERGLPVQIELSGSIVRTFFYTV